MKILRTMAFSIFQANNLPRSFGLIFDILRFFVGLLFFLGGGGGCLDLIFVEGGRERESFISTLCRGRDVRGWF